MGVLVRKLSAAPSAVIDYAKRLGRSLLKAGGMKRSIFDGYIINGRARAGDATAIVDVIDPPTKLLHCQPYIFALPGGSLATSRWRQAVLPMGRDPLQVPRYKQLTYAVGPDPELTTADLRYRLFAGELYVGAPPPAFSFLARGVYAHSLDKRTVGTATIIGSASGTCWLSLYHMDATQRMLRSDATAEQIAALTGGERYESNITLNEGSIGSDLFPDAPYSTYADYTITPGFAPVDLRNGWFYAHTFTEKDDPPEYETKHRADVVIGRYQIAGDYPDSRAVGYSESIISTVGLGGLLEGGNVNLMRSAIAPDGTGLLVAQVTRRVQYDDPPEIDTVRGCIRISFSPTGVGAPSVVRAGALFAGPDDAIFSYAPLVGVAGSEGPSVLCHRSRILKDESETLKQAADDIELVIIDDSTERVVSLGGYHPLVYINRLATMSDGRIAAGVWTYPVGSGDWSTYIVQSMCQCGPDEFAALVRPDTQFTDASTGIHVAIIRISTGSVIDIGPEIMRGSLYMLAGMTCMEQGLWDGTTELKPARLLVTLFREGDAPAEPQDSSLPGTYRIFDSGRSAELAVAYLTASLCYALGSIVAPSSIGG